MLASKIRHLRGSSKGLAELRLANPLSRCDEALAANMALATRASRSTCLPMDHATAKVGNTPTSGPKAEIVGRLHPAQERSFRRRTKIDDYLSRMTSPDTGSVTPSPPPRSSSMLR